jgi:molybdate transport system regulatory protein
MKITYRKAWGQIKAMELQLGLPLVRKQAGGAGGGGAHLTPEARELLVDYLQLARGIGDEVDRRFRKIFL